MDTTQYRLTVNVGKVIEWLEGGVKKDRYVITSIIVDKKNEGDWENIQTITNPDNPDSKPVTMDLGKGSTFHNVVTEYTKFSAVKATAQFYQWKPYLLLQVPYIFLACHGCDFPVMTEYPYCCP